jgi:hypothetical protein
MMAEHATSHLTWYRKPFGRRVARADHPYFAISPAAVAGDSDARRRRDLAATAGL